MPSRHAIAQPDLDFVVDLNCDPDITAAQHAEARKMLVAAMGTCAEPVLRAATHAAAARRELAEHRTEAQRAQLRGIVTAVNDGRVRLVVGGTERVLVRPEGVELGVGQTVLTDAEGRTVLAAGEFLLGGTTYAFCERLEGHYALVRSLRDGPHDELRQLAVVADAVDLGALTPGDHVLGWSIDNGNVVLVTRRLGPPRPSVADDGGMMRRVVRREDIVGLDDVIARAECLFLDAISPAFAPLLEEADPGLVGAVFQGPPGCGKSEVAMLLVCEVRARGGCALYRTASHYLSKWVGEGSAIMRADFAFLDASYDKTGVRPLLVVDELEAIALDRRHGWTLNGGHLDVLDTLLSLLTRSTARMIGISNIADRFLDTALVREGRIPIVPFPPRLGPEQVAALVEKRLAREFGEAVSDLIFAPAGVLAELVCVQLADGRVLGFGAADLATGAAIANGIVRPTLARIAQRDLRAGRAAPLPLTLEELRAATIEYFVERCRTITRDNVRNILPDRIPEDQVVVKVERVAVPAEHGRR